ncbi:MAG: hypothetical protein H7336_07650 [Bacteriovorax sp.]|nr:hypothetical protein [Bacteriovorax sp.]
MKKIIKTLIWAVLIQSILMGQAFTSSRIDALIESDRDQLISDIAYKLDDFKNQRIELDNIEQHLKLTRKGQNIYLKFESIAGGLIMVGIVVGSYKAHFPPGFRAIVSAYLTVTGISHGLIKLNDRDVKKLLDESARLSKKISDSELRLAFQLHSQCKQVEYNPLCSD